MSHRELSDALRWVRRAATVVQVLRSMSYPWETIVPMDTGHPSDRCTIRIVGLSDGTPTDFDGQYVVEYDPSRVGTQPVTGEPMPVFHLVTTPDIARATRFDPSEVVALYRAVDRRNPTRADGEPNRPLTAFTVETELATDVLPPAGWYVDPGYPRYWRWWDGTNWTVHTGAR